MAAPNVTYTFVNSTTADASQVNQNFTDLVNAISDGAKDLNILTLTTQAIYCVGPSTLPIKATTSLYKKVDCSDVTLYEAAGAVSKGVTLKSPAALAAAYSITMPAALPAETVPLTLTSAGVATLATIGTTVLNFNQDAGTGGTNNFTITWIKTGQWVTLHIPTTDTMTSNSTKDSFTAAAGSLDAALRPSAAMIFPCRIRANGTVMPGPGAFRLEADGSVLIQRILDLTLSFNSGYINCGTSGAIGVTYLAAS